jgi:hypothetical protein
MVRHQDEALWSRRWDDCRGATQTLVPLPSVGSRSYCGLSNTYGAWSSHNSLILLSLIRCDLTGRPIEHPQHIDIV